MVVATVCGDIIVWAAVGILDIIVAEGVARTEFYLFGPPILLICCGCGDRLFAHNPVD